MKNGLKCTFSLFLIILGITLVFPKGPISQIRAQDEVQMDLSAPSALLMEYQSGAIIFAKNEHEKLYPASMTKMMGLLLVLEALNEGNIQLEDEVVTSANASSMGGTQIFLEPGEKMIVRDLIKSIAINSANDAMVSLAEYVGGTEENFVRQMNEKAVQLGLDDSHFMNPTGFDDPNHYTSAYDMALLGRELLRFDDIILSYTSQYDAYVREDQEVPFWLVNTNKLVRYYEGMDGLKTGFTQLAGYCLTATAKRNNTRFIAVVMKEKTIDDRSRDITKLLNYGFANYETVRLFSQDSQVGTYSFDQALTQETPLFTKKGIEVVVAKGEKADSLSIELVINQATAPVTPNTAVAQLKIVNSKGWVFNYPIYVNEKVELMTWWDLFLRLLSKLIA